MRGKLGGLVMKVMLVILGLSLAFSVGKAGATETKPYHEGILNSSVLFITATSIQKGTGVAEDETNGYTSLGASFKVHDYIRVGLFGGYEIAVDEGNDRFWAIGGDVLLHFAPDKVVDPFIEFGIGYVRESFDFVSYAKESGYGYTIGGGVEIKAGKFASIIPSVGYTNVKQEYPSVSGDRTISDSASGISPDLSVALRSTDNPDSAFSELWWMPFFSYNFALDDGFLDSYSFGLQIVSTF